MSGIVNDETKISVFRDGRFTQNMIMAAVKSVDEALSKVKQEHNLSDNSLVLLVLATGFAAMIKAYDIQSEEDK